MYYAQIFERIEHARVVSHERFSFCFFFPREKQPSISYCELERRSSHVNGCHYSSGPNDKLHAWNMLAWERMNVPGLVGSLSLGARLRYCCLNTPAFGAPCLSCLFNSTTPERSAWERGEKRENRVPPCRCSRNRVTPLCSGGNGCWTQTRLIEPLCVASTASESKQLA